MWSQKLKSGNVCYRERYENPLTGEIKVATVTIKPSGKKRTDERIAEEALREKIDKITHEAKVKDLTLEELCEKYIARQQREYKPQTAQAARRRLSTIKRLIGNKALIKRLNAPLVADKLYTGSDITYNERLTRFKALMRWAYQAGYIDDVSYLDRLQNKRVPSVRVKDAEKYLEHDEIDKLLSGMTVERWKLVTEFLILSGLRIGEFIALNDSDVDFEKREIHVTKTFSRDIHKISTTKTEMSERDVYMQDELLECAERIKKFSKEEQIQYVFQTDLFLSNGNGDYICYDVYSKYFRENTERILGRRLTPHSLRHTHTALLAESGVPLETISRRLGHADSEVTKNVYFHVTEKMREKDNDKIKSVKMLHVCYT
ncbi:tyrosine-type recombinase/integrase [Bilifractor porci]|uniref:Site-specific integrase n=1 Tax=Bilifractor porci TaxID=2606636 RepID=A0A7X2P785_9FIRM|nr:site-specific integrase [Bilifractor porci]MST81525.1 site-specific integrase [Bilifractor porci]